MAIKNPYVVPLSRIYSNETISSVSLAYNLFISPDDRFISTNRLVYPLLIYSFKEEAMSIPKSGCSSS